MLLSHVAALTLLALPGANWYEDSFYLLHEDHHTSGRAAVGRDADPAETRRLIALSKPDVIQIHAKGRPGWTSYPSAVGHTPPQLARDVLGLWREIARQDGYRFSAYYNIGRDGELVRRHPEWNRDKASGDEAEEALCYHSGVAEGYLWPMIDEIMAKYQPDGFWFDGSCFTVSTCYCPKCVERFERETGLKAPKLPDQKGFEAYREMQRQIYREFVEETARRIHQKDPKCLVAVNWAYSLRMPEDVPEGIDYLTGDHGNHVDWLSGEAHWYDSQKRPFDLMTTVYVRTDKGESPKPVSQMQQELAIIIANGGRYFAWDHPSAESGLSADRLEFLGEVVAPFLRERQQWCLGSRRMPEVSLLNSAASHYLSTTTLRPCFPRPEGRINGAMATLSASHLDYEMVSDGRLLAGEIHTPVLVAEDLVALPAGGAAAMRRFVEKGGTLLVTGGGVTLDGMAELAGVEPAGEAAAAPQELSTEINGESVTFRQRLQPVRPAEGTKTLLSAKGGGRDQLPLATERNLGQGRVIYVAAPLLSEAKNAEVPPALLNAVFEAALPVNRRKLTTDAPATVESVLRRQGGDYVLHLVNRAAGKREAFPTKTVTHYVITDIPPVPQCQVSLKLDAKPGAVRLQPQGNAVTDWSYEGGRLQLTVPGFDIHQMVVIEPAEAR